MTPDEPATLDIVQTASAATDRDSWLALIEEIGEEAGYFERLGQSHWAYFSDQSPTLLVTFETLGTIRTNNPGQMPLAHDLVQAKGWSHLALIAEGDTWFRDAAVYGYFDRLVDDAFFEDFDRVVFYGAGMGAYAACAFSVTAPGATVLAVQPRATLDPSVAGWDRRDLDKRRLCFTDRYGYAPELTEGTGEVFVIHDPLEVTDAMHASLFTGPQITPLRCRHLGGRVDWSLNQLGVLLPMIEAACEGQMSRAAFARFWRKRRQFGPYLRTLLTRNEAYPKREVMICRSVTRRMNAPRFRRRLQELEGKARPGA